MNTPPWRDTRPPAVQMTEEVAEIIAAARFWTVEHVEADGTVHVQTREPVRNWRITVEEVR